MKKQDLVNLIKECHGEILKEEIDETKLITALKANKIRINLLMEQLNDTIISPDIIEFKLNEIINSLHLSKKYIK